MTNKVTVTGSLVSKNGVTLFFADGGTQVLAQDSWRTQDIMELINSNMNLMMTGNGVEIDLDAFSIAAKLQKALGSAAVINDNVDGSVSIGTSGKTKITDIEALDQHIQRALVGEGAKGFANFLKKFGEIKRQHTADELLHFLKQADMPFADDGSILAYKILRQVDDHMVDPHSGKVKQKLGSLVYMPDSKVDDNRRVACSTGLHIASRKYIGGFWGGDDRRLTIVKIQPKDVIAVPFNENKMRVAAYHIVKVLTNEDGKSIAGGKDIFDSPAAHKALEEAVGGSHTSILETVKVTGLGTIEITPVAQKKAGSPPRKRVGTVSKMTPKAKGPVVKVSPADVNILKKLNRHSDLSKFDKNHVKKLVRAQKLLEKGKSLRFIAGEVGLDRDSLSVRLVRKAA